MPYTIAYTDKPNNGTITIADGTLNETTSIKFPGRGYNGYGSAISENFLKILENFASPNEPPRPSTGQLWFNTAPGEEQLKVYDGTSWVPAGGMNRAAEKPDVATSQIGDLWVDTDNQQLYLNSGSGWVLVGPEFSDGLKTGASPTKIIGTDNKEYTVVMVEVDARPVSIIATSEFTPKTSIAGFSSIKPGFNLSNRDITGAGLAKFRGTSEKAESLIINNNTVQAGNFLRGDTTSTTLFPINVQNNTGVIIGTDAALNLGVEGQAGIIQHQIEGSSIDVRVRDEGSSKTVLRIDSSQRLGINNESPQEALDVTGNARIGSNLIVKGTTSSRDSKSGSIQTSGGVGIQENLNVDGDSFFKNLVTVANNIAPNENNTGNIGTAENKFQNIYADTFVGNVVGNVSGTVSGIAGSSNKLTSATTFRLTGDVSADDLIFDGQTGGTTKTFDTSLSNAVISQKSEVTGTNLDDEILLNRRSGTPGLYKVSRRTLLNAVPTNPPGVVMLDAGTNVPDGWLLCDGSEYLISDFPELFERIQYSFSETQGSPSFRVPDFRGRVPLGADSMGGNAANTVTATYAESVGGQGGSQNTQISVGNLPEHEHDLRGDNGDQYFVIRDIAGTPNDTEAIQYDAPNDKNNGQALAKSGGILTDKDTEQPLDVMNPSLTMHYIIFTGRSTQ